MDLVGIKYGAEVSQFTVVARQRRIVRRKTPDFTSVLEKIGEEEDGSFVNMG